MKNTVFIKIAIFIMVVGILSSCNGYLAERLVFTVTNTSPSSIMVYSSYEDSNYEKPYVDTCLYHTSINYLQTIQSGDKIDYGAVHTFSIADWFESLPSDTLMIFVFDKGVVDTEPWEDIILNYKVLCRYDLSLSNLEDLDYVIPYPPRAAMKDMHMFPPYGEGSNRYD